MPACGSREERRIELNEIGAEEKNGTGKSEICNCVTRINGISDNRNKAMHYDLLMFASSKKQALCSFHYQTISFNKRPNVTRDSVSEIGFHLSFVPAFAFRFRVD